MAWPDCSSTVFLLADLDSMYLFYIYTVCSFIVQEGKFGKGSGGGKNVEHASHWAMSFFDRGPALAVTPDGK